MNPDNNQNNKSRVQSCIRPDGSIDWIAMLFNPQVLLGALMIILGLGGSIVLYKVETGNAFIDILATLVCMMLCFSGANSIVNFVNVQQEIRRNIKK